MRSSRIESPGFVAALFQVDQGSRSTRSPGSEEAGPYAVPFLVEALDRAGISADERPLLARNMGSLDRTAVPALLAVLDAPTPSLRPTPPRPWAGSAILAPSRS